MAQLFSPALPRHHHFFPSLSLPNPLPFPSLLSHYISLPIALLQFIANYSKPTSLFILFSFQHYLILFGSMADFGSKKRSRCDSDELADSRFDSPEVKRLREDLLLGSFDDGDIYTASSELDSFMKSFEEEILSGAAKPAPVMVDLTSESGESQPDLGFLLEASDDELGLPPSTGEGHEVSEEKTELVRVESDSSGLSSEFWGYGDDLPNYDSFDAGIVEFGDYTNNGGGGEYVALDGLFDYSDLGFGSNDNIWRPETLHAK